MSFKAHLLYLNVTFNEDVLAKMETIYFLFLPSQFILHRDFVNIKSSGR